MTVSYVLKSNIFLPFQNINFNESGPDIQGELFGIAG